ncbi:FAD-dependent oxidoreductase [Leucobacter coleopterorum]|uniref:FAD-dependent oxidoreductase n=1 Tax=Leucobacter coleopterorum TaxID=2714933 RepID=A0ABX6JY57_9MICO|nr:NAD(P)/FAD-dependent oxidoreductase [Leucobacter coleopterorum]QIM17705.1 FAD-dependent oxidoreductase [Leucobacter coleopterorum]
MVHLLVVGAGPAGMAGALAAADSGFDVLVVDEQARAGGQIFRRPPQAFGGTSHFGPYTWAGDLIERFEAHPRISTSFRSTAYGVLRDRDELGMRLCVGVHTPNGGERVSTDRILIATGAYDMPVAFPGWTSPGVMTVGAAQSLLKSQKVLAGRRVILAGSHPLLLIAAEQLLDAGAEIAEVAFARALPNMAEMASALSAAPGHLRVFAEAGRAVTRLLTRGVKVSKRTIVTEAVGGKAVTGVRLANVDKNWRTVGRTREVHGDLLLLGYGFSPSTELARQAGCEMQWDSRLGGWVVAHDESFATSAEGIYIAGEPTGVSGAEQSWAEGWNAGLHIARSLEVEAGRSAGKIQTELAQARRLLQRSGKFSRVVQSMFEPNREALVALSNPKDTTVCRCELVTSDRIDEVLRNNPFISSGSAVKLECRSGMGPCQGRYCESTVAGRVAQSRGASIESSGFFAAHLPVKPVSLETYRMLSDPGSHSTTG